MGKLHIHCTQINVNFVSDQNDSEFTTTLNLFDFTPSYNIINPLP